MLGATFIISIDNGCVLDYSVKSKVCTICRKFPNPTEEWIEKHKPVCAINHAGSSCSMEKDGAIEMFLRSLDKDQLKYTEYVGDGDTNSFGEVQAALYEKYGDAYQIIKEDYIGHIQKRMGAALRNYKKTNAKVLYYQMVNQSEVPDALLIKLLIAYRHTTTMRFANEEKMVRAIWAIFYHMRLGPPNESVAAQHLYCPDGNDSWCKYKKDNASNTNRYDQTKCLPFVFRKELKPIFDRLSSKELLQSCK